MKLFRSFIVLFLFAFFGCGALIINYIVFPYISLFVKEEEKRKAYCNVIHKTWKFFCTMMQKAGAIKVELTNPEKIKNLKGKIIVANHPSYIDIVLLIGSVPNTICVAKKELKKNIFMGNIVKSLYLINDEESEKMLKNTVEILKEGYNIVIFPSGTRTQENEPLKLHKGAALMALHTHCDIVPVHISCDYKFLAKHQKVYDAGEKPVTYTITINDEIKIEDFSKENLTQIQQRNRINETIKQKISASIQN